MAMTKARHRLYPSVLAGAGLAFLYLGQRIIEVGKVGTGATILGVLMLLGGLGARAAEAQRQPRDRRWPEQALALLAGLVLLAIVLYFLNSSLLLKLTGRALEQSAPKLSGIITALWPALLVAGVLPTIFVEMSLATMKRAPVLDVPRVRAAMLSALGIGFALVFCFAATYVASQRDLKIDLSYFRTARAGDATKKLVRALDRPLQVYLFFPPANEVREEVESYFGDLTRESKQLVVEHFDHDIHLQKARELNVSGNGIIVVARDATKEQIAIPLQLEGARSQLRVLDQEVHKRIIAASRPDRIAYIVQGHDERTFEPSGDTDRRSPIRVVKQLLTDLGFEPRELGVAQGLGSEVPADAAVVLIIGPRRPLMREEMAALGRYLDRKGRMLIALDPDAGQTFEEILAPLSLKYTPVTLAHETMHLNRTNSHADRILIGTGAYSSHASVSTISRLGMRAPTVVMGAGYLEKDEKTAVGLVNVDFTVHADAATWNDKNGNYEFDQGAETRNAYELAAAVTRRNASALGIDEEARVLVLADSDVIADELITRLPGNQYLLRDGIRWLSGEEAYAGTITTEEDVPVAHTRKQDVAYFYSSAFGAPLLVIALGFVMTRRRRSRPKAVKVSPEVAP